MTVDISEFDLTWERIIERARQRREQLNRSLISNPNFKRSYIKESLNTEIESVGTE